MEKTRISDCYELYPNEFIDHKGKLGVLEGIKDFDNNLINFKRCYFLRDFKKEQLRGVHAHKKLYQIFIVFNGSGKINIFDGFNSKDIKLKDGSAFLIVPGIWRELIDFEEESIVVVLASELYDTYDYIYEKNNFIEYKKKTIIGWIFFCLI